MTGEPPEPQKREFEASAFLLNAFSQVKDLPPRKGSFHGKHFDTIVALLESSSNKLKLIREGLPDGILKPKMDMGLDNYSVYNALPEDVRAKVDALRIEGNTQLNDLIKNTLVPAMLPQVLQVDTLEAPQHYYKQKNTRTCSTANFCSIFETITGHAIDEQQVLEAARQYGLVTEEQIPGELIPEEDLIGVFRTKEFSDTFPNIYSRPIHFFGCDFEDLAGFMKRFQVKEPRLKACAMLSIKSEVSAEGWHNIILLSADEKFVTIHDPSNKVGGAFRQLPKTDFIKRWGITLLSGKLVLFSK